MIDAVLVGPATPPELHLMSFNIRRQMLHLFSRNPDHWGDRKWLLRRLLAAERPTLVGVQEAMPPQIRFVAESLGASYRWIGHGRDADGTGEHCPIFYNNDRLRLISWRQLALSSTPEVPGSRSFGNMIPRIALVATFEDRATGDELLVINTHFDHLSRKSRILAAGMLHREVAAATIPVVVTGDFNTGITAAPFHLLAAGGLLVDAWRVAAEHLTPAWGTYSAYRPPRLGRRRIDWILTSPSIEVTRAAINAVRFEGKAASDHEPVQVTVRLGKAVSSQPPAI